MKRILINATHNEEIRVALCKDNHLYDFDLENRTREQKKANIYKGHITRVEPSLEAAFVEYGSARQGFLPLREIASEYLHGNLREDNIKQLIKEGDEVIVQVEKEERGNKGAALSTFISLAGRYLVLMPNNAKAGGISRQISGKVREEMKQIIAGLNLPKGMSVIVRTAGLGKGAEDLQNDLDHLLDIWKSIQEQNKNRPSPCLVHQEAGVVTRAVRDYLRDDIGEVWIDSENAYNEAANFISAVMPAQMSKLRKYTEYEPMFARFGIERQIETAYQREVRLPSGGSIVIDQTEALVSIDINSSKSTKGSDVAETAYHTNLEAADEIARQLRLRDMGGLIVIDFIDMNDPRHQKDVEKRLVEATRHDRARVQFAEISKFGLMEMSRQRLRPSLEEATGYICPRCHGNGMIRDLRSLSLSIMRQIEQIALKERMGEIQAEVPTDIAAFLLNEKRESLVYLEQDSGARITILPHAHLESPNFSLHFNPDGFAPSSYERIADTEEKETVDRGYEVNWQSDNDGKDGARWHKASDKGDKKAAKAEPEQAKPTKTEPQAVAWLSNLFAPKPQAQLAGSLGTTDAASAIEALVNSGGVSLGAAGNINAIIETATQPEKEARSHDDRRKKPKHKKEVEEKDTAEKVEKAEKTDRKAKKDKPTEQHPKREAGSRRESRGEIARGETLTAKSDKHDKADKAEKKERTDKPKADKAERPARQKPSDPNEVVLHVSATKEEAVATQVVHLSLDGSKPKKARTKADKTEHKAEKTEHPNDTVKSATADVVDAAVSESVQESVQDAPIQSTADTAPVTVLDSDNEAVAKPEAIEPTPVADAAPAAEPKPAIDPVLSARIAALAKEMNKAVNDPRVVQAALQAPAAPIRGTAGEFIASVLGANASGQFVADFIAAVAKSQGATTALDFGSYFSNYGYAPMTDVAKAEFDKLTQADAQASAPQGKTAVAPRPIARRAANDPRGQHPDFIEPSDMAADEVAEVVATDTAVETVADYPTKTAETSTQAVEAVSQTDNSETAETVGETVVHLVDDAIDVAKLTAEQVSDTVSEVVSETLDNVATIATAAMDLFAHLGDDNAAAEAIATDAVETEPTRSDVQVETVEATETQAVEITETTENSEALEITETTEQAEKKVSQIKEITAEQKAEKKSKASSYKDMIENVAGQLQPQVGILNLMTAKAPKTPKAPKTRTPRKPSKKPKVEVRKISKTTETAEPTDTSE
ncbi:Rne/Rng family ribonuclease [Moraxella sp. FZFQ2102]|uniref:Rne/Rng family ribonuclease n=1 Tax=Moraxella sp. FZFQ2102 TaxID=2953752 RepID=UPI00209C43BA|nr:Rne/Rng family ribonuclease [Moraxella sp. FZFQ2102]USZ14106.1 Rne/Rng family ribonuclease [Moraxella sp. FZFQ2102]